MGHRPAPGSQDSFPGGGTVCIGFIKDAPSQPGKGGVGLQVVSQQGEKYVWRTEAGEVLAKLFGIWERRGPEEKMGEGEVRSHSEIIKRKDTVSQITSAKSC